LWHDSGAKQRSQVANIERVRVETFYNAVRLGVAQPTTTEEAQFNVAWPVAALLAEGEVGPGQILEGRLADPAIRALAARVEVVEIDELTRLHDLADVGDPAGRYASRVLIALRDGRTLDPGLATPRPISHPSTGARRNWRRSSAGWPGRCSTRRGWISWLRWWGCSRRWATCRH
jgi:2-methylcitrate dehydratase PrpD